MRIGVAVEGPSDKAFWDKILKKYFTQDEFFVRNMGCRTKLIRETPRLVENYRALNCQAVFIILDRDKTPCYRAVIREFDPSIQNEVRKPVLLRYLFIFVAVRELEAWYLADEQAIKAILGSPDYSAPEDTGSLGSEGILKKFWKQHCYCALNKISFAKEMAAHFQPSRAARHSRSFSLVWDRIPMILTRESRDSVILS